MCKEYHKGVNLADGEWQNFMVSRIKVDSTCVWNITRKGDNLADGDWPNFMVNRIQFCGKSNIGRFDICKEYHKEGVN